MTSKYAFVYLDPRNKRYISLPLNRDLFLSTCIYYLRALLWMKKRYIDTFKIRMYK